MPLVNNRMGYNQYGFAPKVAAPKVSKGRPESPLVASAEAKSPCMTAQCRVENGSNYRGMDSAARPLPCSVSTGAACGMYALSPLRRVS